MRIFFSQKIPTFLTENSFLLGFESSLQIVLSKNLSCSCILIIIVSQNWIRLMLSPFISFSSLLVIFFGRGLVNFSVPKRKKLDSMPWNFFFFISDKRRYLSANKSQVVYFLTFTVDIQVQNIHIGNPSFSILSHFQPKHSLNQT